MRIGIKVNLFNFNLRNKRMELGYTQVELAEKAGCCPAYISDLETLKTPRLSFERILNLLNTVSNVLVTPVEELFPDEFIKTLIKKYNIENKFLFLQDVPLDNLLSSPVYMALSSGTEINNEELGKTINETMSSLSNMEFDILEKRFGLNGEQSLTLQEIATTHNITCRRASQIVQGALSKLRNPRRSKNLRKYLMDKG